ncbi:MAG: GatB/YqeY domain-containing protein [Chloroflexi bacterium]|nr:GatB/YqeY domain-containing protein [Chloroflexota bacterium]
MSLKEQLANDLTDALRQGDETRKSTIRMLMSAISTEEVAGAERRELGDDEVLKVVARQVKQRRDSIEEFNKAGRDELAEKEAAELQILRAYMPEQAGREEIEAEARKVIAEIGATGPQDKGKVMQAIMPRLAGRAEGRDINDVVTQQLSAL